MANILTQIKKTGKAIGGFKFAAKTADHNGWILLNGRATNTLTATQQAYIVVNYPWLGNLPNFTGRELIDNGGVLGTLAGADTYSLTQANLPSYNMTGSLDQVNNNHNHAINNGGAAILHPAGGAFNFNQAGGGNSAGPRTVGVNLGGAHNHSFQIPLGAGTAINTETSYLSFNAFVYLGT